MGPVVVGIDGSDAAAEALRVAIAEARLRGTSVVAVHVWQLPVGDFLAGFAPPQAEIDELEASAGALLARTVSGADHAGVAVEPLLRESQAAGETLVAEAAARGAELLVVGSRGLGGLKGLLLGSVSAFCSRHAGCPVLVVHPLGMRATPAA